MTVPCRVAGAYPLTFQQYARLERARQAVAAGVAPRSDVVPSACDVTGPLSLAAVRSAALAVFRRHPALRLAFRDGFQIVTPCSAADVNMSIVDEWLAGEGPGRADGESVGGPAYSDSGGSALGGPDGGVASRGSGGSALGGPDGGPAGAKDRTPVWMPAPPVLAASEHRRLALSVARTGSDRFRVRVWADHLAFDGASLKVFWRDFWAAYAEHAGRGRPADPACCECDPSFLDFAAAAARRSQVPPPGLDEAVALLRAADSPLGFAPFPVRLPLSQVGSRAVTSHTVDLGERWWPSFAAYARANRCTPFAAATAAVFSAIAARSAADRPMLYTYLQNRRTAAEQEAIGWFAATVLLLAPAGVPGAYADLRSVRSVINEALTRGDVFTELLHRRCGGGRRAATLPSVSLAVTPVDGPDTPLRVGGLTVRRVPTADGDGWLPRGRMAVEISPLGRITVRYETERFADGVAEGFAAAICERLAR